MEISVLELLTQSLVDTPSTTDPASAQQAVQTPSGVFAQTLKVAQNMALAEAVQRARPVAEEAGTPVLVLPDGSMSVEFDPDSVPPGAVIVHPSSTVVAGLGTAPSEEQDSTDLVVAATLPAEEVDGATAGPGESAEDRASPPVPVVVGASAVPQTPQIVSSEVQDVAIAEEGNDRAPIGPAPDETRGQGPAPVHEDTPPAAALANAHAIEQVNAHVSANPAAASNPLVVLSADSDAVASTPEDAASGGQPVVTVNGRANGAVASDPLTQAPVGRVVASIVTNPSAVQTSPSLTSVGTAPSAADAQTQTLGGQVVASVAAGQSVAEASPSLSVLGTVETPTIPDSPAVVSDLMAVSRPEVQQGAPAPAIEVVPASARATLSTPQPDAVNAASGNVAQLAQAGATNQAAPTDEGVAGTAPASPVTLAVSENTAPGVGAEAEADVHSNTASQPSSVTRSATVATPAPETSVAGQTNANTALDGQTRTTPTASNAPTSQTNATVQPPPSLSQGSVAGELPSVPVLPQTQTGAATAAITQASEPGGSAVTGAQQVPVSLPRAVLVGSKSLFEPAAGAAAESDEPVASVRPQSAAASPPPLRDGDGAPATASGVVRPSALPVLAAEQSARAATRPKAGTSASVTKGPDTTLSTGFASGSPATAGDGATVQRTQILADRAGNGQVLGQTIQANAGQPPPSGEGTAATPAVVQHMGQANPSAMVQTSVPVEAPAGAGLGAAAPEAPARPTLGTLGRFTVRSVRYLVGKGGQTLSVRLIPESLGVVQIRVTSVNDALHVTVASASAHVREALDGLAAGLRDSLSREGIDVARITVSANVTADTSGGGSPGSRAGAHHGAGTRPMPPSHAQYSNDSGRSAGTYSTLRTHDGALNLIA